jgi:hypothetical protein
MLILETSIDLEPVAAGLLLFRIAAANDTVAVGQ